MERLSKFLSWVLRHRPDVGVQVDSRGWATVDELLMACEDQGLPASREALQTVVRTSDKQRFELEGDRIRCRQGHSFPVVLEYPVQAPPDRLFHGTIERFLPSIREHGLIPGQRHAVHLSADRATATAVGSRRGAPVILVVRARELAESGADFRLTPNGVWLVSSVPPEFIE